jgi:hypothetical protein
MQKTPRKHANCPQLRLLLRIMNVNSPSSAIKTRCGHEQFACFRGVIRSTESLPRNRESMATAPAFPAVRCGQKCAIDVGQRGRDGRLRCGICRHKRRCWPIFPTLLGKDGGATGDHVQAGQLTALAHARKQQRHQRGFAGLPLAALARTLRQVLLARFLALANDRANKMPNVLQANRLLCLRVTAQ